MGSSRRIHAAVFSFIAGVMPPMPMLGRSLLCPEPYRGLILCLFAGFKDVLVEPFVANRAVVAFDIGVLLGFFGLDIA